jgi:hypothetical protein
MSKTSEMPQSKKINEYAAKDFWITAASWDTGYGPSYEIGIRRKDNGAFELLQSSKYSHLSVQECAEAIRVLLDEGFSPGWLKEYMT